MPILTSCPSCKRQLRVPDDLLGRQVKCPQCNATFTVNDGAGEPALAPTVAAYEGAPGAAYVSHEQAANAVKGPAIALIVTGVLSLLVGLWLLIQAAVILGNPALVEEQLKQAVEEQQKNVAPDEPPPPDPFQDPELMKGIMAVLGPGLLGLGGLGVLTSIVVIIGGAKMLGLRSIGLARTGSVLAMLPFSPCCILGLIFGIWSLAVLGRPEVKSAFH